MKNNNAISLSLIVMFVFASAIYFPGCGKREEMGIGPIKEEVKLPPNVDMTLAIKGKQTFISKCSVCHRIDSRLVGPSLRDVTKRRRPEWIMNQILNPQQMTRENKYSKELLAQYKVPMIFQGVNQDDARAILEYFRALDSNQLTEK